MRPPSASSAGCSPASARPLRASLRLRPQPRADLLLVNISVSLLASFVPIPGGIGVAEFGLTVGLVAAGMPEETALATALLYRIATFYVPPVWGFFAMGWLRRNEFL